MLLTGKINHNLALFRNNFTIAWGEVFGQNFSRFCGILVLILNSISWLGSFLLYRSLGDELTVLHYNIDFGIDLIGRRGQLFVNPALGLILIILDLSLLLLLTRHQHFKLISFLLWGTMILANIFLILAVLGVYLINFR
ncbi:MAG: hypothetical protein WC564_04870 [Patescibacteria group bacterium]